MKTLIHIGYPKCLSTTLQREIFDRIPDVFFGGIGVGDNISYCNEQVEFIFESLIKYSSESFFEKNLESAQGELATLRDQAGGKPLVFSSEHLSYGFTPHEVDVSEKLRRVHHLFGEGELHLLVVVRRPEHLLKSLYKEYVRTGYVDDFPTFVTWFYRNRDRSGYEQFLFDEFVERLKRLIPVANVVLCFFEDLVARGVGKEMAGILNLALDIRVPEFDLAAHNQSLSHEETGRLLAVNRKYRRGIGWSSLKGFEEHRNRRLVWEMDPDVREEEVFEDVLAKRRALAMLPEFEAVPDVFELTGKSGEYWNRMMDDFRSAYQKLESAWKAAPGSDGTESRQEQ